MLDNTSGFSDDKITLFNTYFRGKYVHCINWKYVVPLEEMTVDDVKNICDEIAKIGTPRLASGNSNSYITTDNILAGSNFESLYENESAKDAAQILDEGHYHWLELSNIQNYIDLTVTTELNDINKYIAYNAFMPSDLTTDEIKLFRTWLASTILSFNTITDTRTLHMLKYYAGGMYNDVVAGLTMFGDDVYTISIPGTSSCGCNQSAQTIAQLQSISSCQPLTVYRKHIYDYMITIFADLDWWMEFDPEFLQMFKTYIDNIIKMNLPFVGSSYIDDYIECGCMIGTDTKQKRAVERLKKLSESLQMMIDDNITGHRNYITNALTEWATYLYELMQW